MEAFNEVSVQLTDVIAAEQKDVVHRGELDDYLQFYEANLDVPEVEHQVCDEFNEFPATVYRLARSNIGVNKE